MDNFNEDLIKKGEKVSRQKLGLQESQEQAVFEGGHSQEEQKQAEVKNKQAVRIINLVQKTGIELFRDQYDKAYVRIPVGNYWEIYPVESSSFEGFIRKAFYDSEGASLNSSVVKEVIGTLAAKACFEYEQKPLAVRVARKASGFFYDLGGGRTVEVNGKGWRVVHESPVLFRRFKHQQRQVVPERVNEPWEQLKTLRRFCNVANEEELLLLVVFLVTALIADIPHPVLLVYGDQGSGKSSMLKICKELIDPSTLSVLSLRRSQKALVQQLSHHWFVPLDNLSSLHDSTSDILCRAVTGGGFSKRKLYTDDEDVIYEFKRVVALNGINLVAEKADLLDRSLILGLSRIDDSRRKRDRLFWEEFRKVKPMIMGSLFSLLSHAVDEIDEVSLESMSRMADFEAWGCAISRVLGKGDLYFSSLLNRNVSCQNATALNSNPIGWVIKEFMSTRKEWSGTPQELFNDLDPVADELGVNKSKKYPKAANWVWRRIREVRPNLEAEGIQIFNERNDQRTICIRRDVKNTDDNADGGDIAKKANRRHDGTDGISGDVLLEGEKLVNEARELFG